MSINKELIKGCAKTIVLQLLADKSAHGYELLTILKEKTAGQLEFTEGTLYPLLHQLEQENFVNSVWTRGQGERKRKVYEITSDGRKLLQIKSQELFAFIDTMKNLIASRDSLFS